MPLDVHPFVNGLVEKVAIQGMAGVDPLWQVVKETLIAYPTTVSTNTVIAAYTVGDGSFVAREVGMHRAERPLGFHFTSCGTPGCESKDRPGHIIGELRESNARIRCKACKWRSKNVRVDKQELILPLHETKAPLLFYHEFPSPARLYSMFL